MARRFFAGSSRRHNRLIVQLLAALLPLPAAAATVDGAEASGDSWAAPPFSKSAAILGGAVSALELMRLQQSGQDAPTGGSPAEIARSLPTFAIAPVRPMASFSENAPDVFGTVALTVSGAPLDRQWRRASAVALERDGRWSKMLHSAHAKTRHEQLEQVNLWVNRRVEFQADSEVHGTEDRWVTADQTLEQGRGDCEDFAIAKMQLLRRLGFSADDLYLTIVRDLLLQADHAVLVVRLDGRFLVLDNNNDIVSDARDVRDMRPIMTYAAAGAWVHGYRRAERFASLEADTMPAAAPAGLTLP